MTSYLYAGEWGPEAAVDNTGRPQAGAQATLYLADGLTQAVRYTDRTKATATSNPWAADSRGNVVLFADPGSYVLEILVKGVATRFDITVPIDPAEAVLAGRDPKESCRVATTANLGALSGLLTIDGVVLVAGDRALVKDQIDGTANGIYVASAVAWTRATDADTSGKLTAGSYTFVTEGTANGGTGFTLITADPITLGTTALVWSATGGVEAIIAGTALVKSGHTIGVAAGGITDTEVAAANKDGLTSKASLRTLGTGAQQATAGNDSRLSDQRVPTDSSVTDAKVAGGAAIAESKLALASDAVAGTPSRRTLGTGAQQAAAGNDARLSDKRVPVDGSVADTQVSAISESKITGLAADLAAKLVKTSNLSDVADVPTARANLGVSPSLTRTTVKSAATYTAAANELVPVDTTANPVTVALPNAPADKVRVAVKHIVQGGTNAVTVACAGVDVFNRAGGATTMTLPLLAQAVLLDYDLATHIWTILADDLPLADLDARYPAKTGDTFTGEVVVPDLKATGKTGATATPVTLAGGTASGAPASGAHLKGEIVPDDTGVFWYCTVAGTPGTWVRAGQAYSDAAYASKSTPTVTGSITVQANSSGANTPLLNFDAFGVDWQIGIDTSNDGGGRDLFISRGLQRTISDLVTTSGSVAVTSALQARFGPNDNGKAITGAGIPNGTTLVWTAGTDSLTAARLSANATASATVTGVIGSDPSAVQDIMFVRENGGSGSSFGFGLTPPNGTHRIEIAADDGDPTFGNLRLRIGPSQTGDALTVKDSGGTLLAQMDNTGRLVNQKVRTSLTLEDATLASSWVWQFPGGGILRLKYNTGGVSVVDYGTDKSATFYGNVVVSGSLTIADTKNIILSGTTGTKIGTATTQKLAFYNSTPIVQPSGTPVAATDLATVISLANSLRTNLLALGLVA